MPTPVTEPGKVGASVPLALVRSSVQASGTKAMVPPVRVLPGEVSRTLTIQWFRQDAVTTATGTVVDLPRGARRVLAYLCVHGAHAPVLKERVAAALWPDSLTAQARANLRKSVTLLRHAHPDLAAAVGSTHRYLQWQALERLTVDVWRFDQAYRQGTASGYAEAVRLYRGDLLPGWEDEWLVPSREALRAQYLSSLDQVVQAALRHGEGSQAVAAARMRYEADPFDEAALRRLIETYRAIGQDAAAVRALEAGAALIRRELGVELSPATVALRTPVPAPRRTPRQPTGAAVVPQSADLFVGRERECTMFRATMLRASETPRPLIQVVGPGGSGKTTLLRHWATEVEEAGQPAVVLDGADLGGSPDRFLARYGRGSMRQVAAHLSRRGPVLFLDGVEHLGALRPFLFSQFFPELGPRVGLVLAGRFSAVPAINEAEPHTRRPIHTLVLGAFSREAAHDYLRQRGFEDSAVRTRLLETCGRHPLALALAADLAQTQAPTAIDLLPGWPALVHRLADDILREVPDVDTLWPVLAAGTIARHVNEELVQVVTGSAAVRTIFEQMAHRSFVQMTAHGLTVHDDVRRVLAQAFQSARPGRWRQIRRQVLEYLYEQTRATADFGDRGLWMEELLYAAHHALLDDLLFPEPEDGSLWLDTAQPDDRQTVRDLWRTWLVEQNVGDLLPSQLEALDQCLDAPWFRLRLVRRVDGAVVGFDGHLPVCQESLPLLQRSPQTAAILRGAISPATLATLPAGADHAPVWILRFAVFRADERERARALLLRDLLTVFVRNRRYLATTNLTESQQFFKTLGFRPVPAAIWAPSQTLPPFLTFELDLSSTHRGFAQWVSDLLEQLAR